MSHRISKYSEKRAGTPADNVANMLAGAATLGIGSGALWSALKMLSVDMSRASLAKTLRRQPDVQDTYNQKVISLDNSYVFGDKKAGWAEAINEHPYISGSLAFASAPAIAYAMHLMSDKITKKAINFVTPKVTPTISVDKAKAEKAYAAAAKLLQHVSSDDFVPGKN